VASFGRRGWRVAIHLAGMRPWHRRRLQGQWERPAAEWGLGRSYGKGSLQATSSGFRLRARDAVARRQARGGLGPVPALSGVGEALGSRSDQPPFAEAAGAIRRSGSPPPACSTAPHGAMSSREPPFPVAIERQGGHEARSTPLSRHADATGAVGETSRTRRSGCRAWLWRFVRRSR